MGRDLKKFGNHCFRVISKHRNFGCYFFTFPELMDFFWEGEISLRFLTEKHTNLYKILKGGILNHVRSCPTLASLKNEIKPYLAANRLGPLTILSKKNRASIGYYSKHFN